LHENWTKEVEQIRFSENVEFSLLPLFFPHNSLLSHKTTACHLILNRHFIFAGGLMINITVEKTAISIVGIRKNKKLASG
jgi:hypothetical protein